MALFFKHQMQPVYCCLLQSFFTLAPYSRMLQCFLDHRGSHMHAIDIQQRNINSVALPNIRTSPGDLEVKHPVY